MHFSLYYICADNLPDTILMNNNKKNRTTTHGQCILLHNYA